MFLKCFISNHPYRILIIGGSGSGRTNALLNSIKEQDGIDKIYLYAKNFSEPKYEYLIKEHEDVGIKYCNDSNAFVECSNRIHDIYQNIDDHNSIWKRKILIVLDDMIAYIMSNKKFQIIINKLFIRCGKLNISYCVCHSVLFFCSKRLEIKFNTLFDYQKKTTEKNPTKYCN